MTKASDNAFPSILIADTVDPAAPSNGFHRLFVDTDEKLKMIDHASLVTDFTPGAGGDITTDPAWAAAGDLIVATGNNAASVLTKGTDGDVLTMVSGAVTWDPPAGGGGTFVIGDWAGATTQTVSGNATWLAGTDEVSGRDVLSVKFDSQTASDLSAILKTIGGSSPWRIQTAIRFLSPFTNYTMAGLVFTDGTATSSGVVFGMMSLSLSAPAATSVYMYRSGTLTNFDVANTLYIEPLAPSMWQILHLRLTWVSANTWKLEVSPDAVSWTTFGVANPASTLTPTHVGLAVSSYAATVDRICTFEYFLEESA